MTQSAIDGGVRAAAASLTKAQRYHVLNGCISGDFSMSTVSALRRKGLFELVIDSPNGRYGLMKPTALGQQVRDYLRALGGQS